MKIIRFKIYLLILFMFFSCEKEKEIKLATLNTSIVNEVTSNSALSGGNITDDGGEKIIQRGVCWSTNINPTIKDSLTKDSVGAGKFVSHLSSLTPKTVYYVRAYAVNSAGVAYDLNQQTFTTSITVPSIITNAINSISSISATCGGNISADGGDIVITRGVCWSTIQKPTISDYKTNDGSGLGIFFSSIAGLKANTLYYVRAYSSNSFGTSYGEQKSFTTAPAVSPIVTTASISQIFQMSAKSGGNVTFDGGVPISERGVCWSTSPNPTIIDKKSVDGFSDGIFISVIKGLSANTTYYVRAYASNGNEIGYGNQETFKTLEVGKTIIDADENEYNFVTIGTQIWMKENLKVTHFRNGEAIPLVTSTSAWSTQTSSAYCDYNNEANISTTYGRMYNFYTVIDSRNLCPSGWHVPSNAEWTILTNFLGGTSIAGGKMKEAGFSHWESPNEGATNISGFNGLPSGMRYKDGGFYYLGRNVYYWSSTESSSTHAYTRHLIWNGQYINQTPWEKNNGYYIRCIKD